MAMRRSRPSPPATRQTVPVARFVIDNSATQLLAADEVQVPADRELYAPTLWRSEVLAAVYEAVRSGVITEDDAKRRLAYVNALKIRLLGDAVLRRRAWELAHEVDLPTTFPAEYVALAHLQKCTLVSTDKSFLQRVAHIVPTATIETLTS